MKYTRYDLLPFFKKVMYATSASGTKWAGVRPISAMSLLQAFLQTAMPRQAHPLL